jgi:hypothetical protein
MLAWIKVKMAKWNPSEEVQIHLVNLGTHDESQMVKLNTNLDPFIANATKQLLKKYKDVFAWTYKDLRHFYRFYISTILKLELILG